MNLNRFVHLPIRSLISTACLAVGLMFFVYANWLQIKAEVAQVLIAQAWQQTLLLPSKQHKPWQWADFWPIAELQLEQNKPVYVLSSASGQALAFGPGHMLESSLPGREGQVVIAGHKDSHFSFLQAAVLGDEIQLKTRLGSKQSYSINSKDIVDSDNSQLQFSDNDDELILITCYPFNSLQVNGPLRLVVTASRIKKNDII